MPQPSIKSASDTPVIPDRLYFKIGDVARLCGVEAYVLRFWETQFPQLKPNKSGTGQRLYRRRDVELALEIKRLVHSEGYTIAGARQALESGPRRHGPESAAPAQAAPAPPKTRPEAVAAVIGHARAELREIAELLASPDPKPSRPRGRLVRVGPEAGNLFPV